MKVLYFDNQLDLDVDVHDVAQNLNMDFKFYGLGKGLYKSFSWRPMKTIGETLKIDTDEDQYYHLKRLIEKEEPVLIWVRSLTVNHEIVYDLADKNGIDVVFWITEQGATRDAIFELAKNYRKLIVNNVDDIVYYKKHCDSELYFLPFCINEHFYRKYPPKKEFSADLVSYGNPIYNDQSYTAEKMINMNKKLSVDWMLMGALKTGLSIKVWGHRGGIVSDKGWLQVPYLNNKVNAVVDKLTDLNFPTAQFLKRVYFSSKLGEWKSFYQGVFAWEELPVINSSCKFFANIDHNFQHFRTYSPKLTRAMASGAVVIHMPTPGIEEDFEDMGELIVINSLDECIEKLEFVKKHPEKMTEMSNNAMAKVRKEWNYDEKLPKLLHELGH
jgi:spore maturation protein CgeB